MKAKIHTISKKFLQHELIQGSTYLFLGTFGANVLGFLFNLVVIRKLVVSDYAIYASLIALFTILTIPSSSLVPVMVKFATEFLSKQEIGKAKEFFLLMTRSIILFMSVFLLLFLLFSPAVDAFLGLKNITYLIFVALLTVIVYVSIVNIAFLQSTFRFDFLAGTTIIGACIRLIAGFFLLLIGLKLYGIFLALLLTFFLPYLLTFYPLRHMLLEKSGQVKIHAQRIFRYGLPTSFSTLAMSSLITSDILLVKHFFSPTQAGVYAGLSLVGKIILYFTGPIPQVMFPLLVKRITKKENPLPLFLFAGSLVILPSICLTIFYFLFPQFILTVFAGGKAYSNAAGYLGIFAIFITLYSTMNILVTFLLSMNNTRIVYMLSIGACAQILGIWFFHATFMQVITISTGITLVMLIVLLLYYGKAYGIKSISLRLINNSSI